MRHRRARRLITGVAGSFFILCSVHVLAAAQQWSVSSPDGTINAVVSYTTNLSYSVSNGAGVVVSAAPLGLDGFSDTLSFVSAQTVPVADSFPLYSGKKSVAGAVCAETKLSVSLNPSS